MADKQIKQPGPDHPITIETYPAVADIIDHVAVYPDRVDAINEELPTDPERANGVSGAEMTTWSCQALGGPLASKPATGPRRPDDRPYEAPSLWRVHPTLPRSP